MSDTPLQPPKPPASPQTGGYVPVGSPSLSPATVKPAMPAPQAAPVSTPVPSPAPKPAAPATPPPAPAPAAPAPVYTSRILQGAQAISSEPFKDPKAGTPPAPSAGPALAPIAPTSATSTTVPKESAGFAATVRANFGEKPASVAPSSGPTTGGVKPPVAAAPPSGGVAGIFKQPRNLLIAGIVVVLLVLVGVGALFLRGGTEPEVAVNTTSNKTATNVKLTYWGLWEPAEVMQPLIDQYQSEHPGVTIEYTQQKRDQYRQRLQAAIRDGSGPDIFRFHNDWMPMIKSDLAPSTKGTLTADEVQKNYYPLMATDLVSNGQLYGAPLMYEGLGLLYNESMLQAANATPPKDWEQVRTLAKSLSVVNGGRLERGGIALGSASNVDNFSDILGLMMLQNSANPGNPVTDNEKHALTFYTIFTRSDGVWDETLPNSSEAFANEKVAMIIVPSWRIFDIQRLNPNLKFGVTRLPQLSDQTTTWGTYWAEGVSKASTKTDEAWKFLAWLSQPEQLRRFHSNAASYRGFGEMYPRVDMAADLKQNPLLSPYLDDALYAKSWYMASQTYDEGLNDKMIQYYTNAVNAANAQGDASQALLGVLPGIQQVLTQYGLSTAPAGQTATP